LKSLSIPTKPVALGLSELAFTYTQVYTHNTPRKPPSWEACKPPVMAISCVYIISERHIWVFIFIQDTKQKKKSPIRHQPDRAFEISEDKQAVRRRLVQTKDHSASEL